ncbi:MAG: ankyrin repeat domain-containing protein [Pseudomonadota bacterium]
MSQEMIDRCAKGDLASVKSMVQEGADVNYRGSHGNTPLAFSAFIGHLDLIHLLMDAGADPNSPGYEDSVPVGLAAYEGHSDAVRLLLERGANPNIANATTGVTPLHEAIVKDTPNQASCVMHLLAAGADPNAVSGQDAETNAFFESVRVYSESPLHWAAAYGTEETIRLLIQHGADVSLIDGRGETPAQWAGRHQRSTEIRELLRPA